MNSLSPHTIKKQLELLNCPSNHMEILLEDALELYNKGLPIIFTLPHLALLTCCSYPLLHIAVTRKAILYNTFKLKKRSGGFRVINVPEQSLQLVQNYIKSKILDSNYVHNQIHSSVFSYRKRKSIVEHAKQHKNPRWLIKIDIKDFFSSINESLVYDVFRSFGYSPLLSFELARLVTIPKDTDEIVNLQSIQNKKYTIYTYPTIGVLPQGAPTSPQLSNIIFASVDKKLEELASKFRVVYTRYADDMYFSTSILDMGSAKTLLSEAINIIQERYYTVNIEKTKIFTPKSKKIITGLVVEGERVYLPKAFKDNIKKDLFFVEKHGFGQQSIHLKFKTARHFIENLYGRIYFAKQVELPLGIRYEKKFNELCDKYGFHRSNLMAYKNAKSETW